MIDYSGPCDHENGHCTETFYLDCCRFAVYHVLVLPDGDDNSVNAWKIRSIFLRAILFLKYTGTFSNVRKRLSLRDVQLNSYRPRNTTKVLPSRRRKSFWFVEKRHLCRARFSRPPYYVFVENIYISEIFEHKGRLKMAGIKSSYVTSWAHWPIKNAVRCIFMGLAADCGLVPISCTERSEQAINAAISVSTWVSFYFPFNLNVFLCSVSWLLSWELFEGHKVVLVSARAASCKGFCRFLAVINLQFPLYISS